MAEKINKGIWRDIKITDILIVILTFFIVICTIKQTQISNSLEKVAKLQEESRLITSKKDLRKISFEIMDLFSPKGINERANYSKEENLKLAKKFAILLQEGFDNYLLVKDKNSLSHWVNAVQILDFYCLNKDILKPYVLLSDKEIKTDIKWTDEDFNKMFIDHMGKAFTEVMLVFVELKLNLVDIK